MTYKKVAIFSVYTSLLSMLFTFLTIASAQSFAAFTVEPYGDQIYDVSTGATTLPSGGKLIDKTNNMVLDASYIKYLENTYIEAINGNLSAGFGSLEAPDLRIDLNSQILTASGSVYVRSNNLDIYTSDVYIYLGAGIILVRGQVYSESPAFNGSGSVIDSNEQVAFLLPPYSYQDGPFLLRSDNEKLQLKWYLDTSGNVVFDSTDDIDPTIAERLAPYMP
ncbi:MAG: hypothetical protein R2880_13145 [Deinococcales bacterium]